jgi:hypothetical protein
MTSPLCLTDAQMSALLAASYPLHANQRNEFLETCARELARLGDIGDGDVHRVVMAVQKRFWDPPQFVRDNGASRSRRRIDDDDVDDRPRERQFGGQRQKMGG